MIYNSKVEDFKYKTPTNFTLIPSPTTFSQFLYNTLAQLNLSIKKASFPFSLLLIHFPSFIYQKSSNLGPSSPYSNLASLVFLLNNLLKMLPPPPPLPLAPPPRHAVVSQPVMDQQFLTPDVSPLLTPPPPRRKTRSSPLTHFFISKNNTPNNQVLTPDVYPSSGQLRDLPILKKPRRTNPMIWCSAILCLIFSLLLIFLGIATLIIFLVVKPRNPLFDTNNARLSVIYFDSPEHFNSDFTILANFSNPNRKLNVIFEYVVIELYFDNNLIATQELRPFSQRPRETGLATVHLISSLVYLPQSHALELQKQVLSNKVMYSIRGTFRIRVSIGLIHFSYWLHGRCQLEMTSPPTGVLMARSCRTKR